MFSDHNVVSSKRVVGTAIVLNMMAVFDAVKLMNNTFTAEDVSIFWIFAVLALAMWGYPVIERVFKK